MIIFSAAYVSREIYLEMLLKPLKIEVFYGDIIDLRRNDYDEFNVREFYVKMISGLKGMGF